MRIEDEIQSNKFEDNYHKVVVNIKYTDGWLNNEIRPHFEKYNLTVQQFNILRTKTADIQRRRTGIGIGGFQRHDLPGGVSGDRRHRRSSIGICRSAICCAAGLKSRPCSRR